MLPSSRVISIKDPLWIQKFLGLESLFSSKDSCSHHEAEKNLKNPLFPCHSFSFYSSQFHAGYIQLTWDFKKPFPEPCESHVAHKEVVWSSGKAMWAVRHPHGQYIVPLLQKSPVFASNFIQNAFSSSKWLILNLQNK